MQTDHREIHACALPLLVLALVRMAGSVSGAVWGQGIGMPSVRAPEAAHFRPLRAQSRVIMPYVYVVQVSLGCSTCGSSEGRSSMWYPLNVSEKWACDWRVVRHLAKATLGGINKLQASLRFRPRTSNRNTCATFA